MPKNLWIRRIGETLHPVSADDKAKLIELKEGLTLEASIKMPRSNPHLKLFFAAIKEACENWPESHEFQTKHPERLRAWLLCKAGDEFREHLKYETTSEEMSLAMVGFLETILEHLEVKAVAVASANKVFVLSPKSIAFNNMDQKEFNEISQRVSSILLEATKRSLDDFKNEVKRAA